MDLPRPIHDFLLVFLGSSLLLRGMGVVLLTNPIYSAFSLGLVLVCISLFCILSNFLILFAVMFMNGSEYYKNFNLWTIGNGLTSLVCTNTSWYGIIWTTRSNQIIEQDLISNSQQIGIHLATDFFLPLEFISIILLVSLIGAIAVAR
ncbi:hypothetical protein ES332_A08G134400v1 [Gossypium tomentosum]|uniref:NAD(P)H-quinone oxidoreductase subunit 6, chloroplastic n=1 Tax=Gossypium tomentosum TaxID=34277 RepID=A0A5D2PF32_GOSTO|nr:hypothetical protein ES332_A08G134400v1 [Gossypium tomentosum]